MIVSNGLIKSKLRWLQVCIILGAAIALPLGLTNAQQDSATASSAVSDGSLPNSQIVEIDKEINDLKTRIDKTQAAMEEYRSRVEETPATEEKLLELKRNYEIMHSMYNALYDRKHEAEISFHTENKQSGETEKDNQGEELQAQRATYDFLSDELEKIQSQLEQSEEALRIYREKHMGRLPEQLDSNLSILSSLTKELEQYNSNLRDAENRKAAIVRDKKQWETMGVKP